MAVLVAMATASHGLAGGDRHVLYRENLSLGLVHRRSSDAAQLFLRLQILYWKRRNYNAIRFRARSE